MAAWAPARSLAPIFGPPVAAATQAVGCFMRSPSRDANALIVDVFTSSFHSHAANLPLPPVSAGGSG